MFKKVSRWWRRPERASGYVVYTKTIVSEKVLYELRFIPQGEEELADLKKHPDGSLLLSYQEGGWDIEQTLLDHFGRQAIRMDKGKRADRYMSRNRCGAIFDKDVLGLDDQLYLEAIKAQKEAELKEQENAGEGCLSLIVAFALAPFTLGFSLLFVLYGGACLWESAKSTEKREQYEKTKRPVHPGSIQDLLKTLTSSRVLP